MKPVRQVIQFFLHRTRSYQINDKEQPSAISNSAGGTKNKSEGSILCRHIVALIGFGVLTLLNIHRMNMTISIVAMVKQSSSLPTKGSNISSESCPELQHQMKEENSTQNYSEKDFDEATDDLFDWSPKLQGYILGSSFAGYFLTQFIAGKLSEMFGCKWIIFWGVLFSSLTTFLTPFVSWWNVYMLIAVQTVRGMAQGVFQASLSVLAANWFPAVERGCLFGFMMSGMGTGVWTGGLITGYLCQTPFVGWPSVFYICGAVGIIFAFVIAIFLYENPSVHPRIHENELKFILSNQESKLSHKRPNTPWRSIFSSIPVYALAFAIFGLNWSGTQFLAIHPTFLGTILHLSISQNGLFTSMPFLLQTVFTLSACLISNTLTKNNYVSVNRARKFWNFLSSLGYSVCLMGIYFAKCNRTMSIAFSFVAAACLGFGFTGSMIVPADMTPTFAGSVMGLTSTIGSTAGFILPLIAGYLTDGMQTLEEWDKIFFTSVGVVMASGVVFCIFGSAEVQSWNYVEEKAENDAEKEETSRY